MSKPDNIPQDVWEVAIDAADDWFEVGDKFYRPCAIHFAQIILAAKAEERGACAAIATNFATTSNTRDVDLIMQEAAAADTAEGIAAAIRKRGEA